MAKLHPRSWLSPCTFNPVVEERMKSLSPCAAFVIQIDLRPEPFPWQDHDPIEDEQYLHYFRIETRISDDLRRADMPWQQVYVGRPFLHAKLIHGHRYSSLLEIGYSKAVDGECMHGQTSDVRVACKQILWHLDDPDCHEKLAQKVSNAIGYYVLSRMPLPDH